MASHIKESKSRIVFSVVNYIFFSLCILLCAYPLWYIFIQSLSGTHMAGKGLILPYQPTLSNYAQVMATGRHFPEPLVYRLHAL